MKGKFTHKGSSNEENRSGGIGTIRGAGMTRRLGWPSAGMVVGCLALIVAVGGTGYAASGSGSQGATVASSSKAAGSSPRATVAKRRGRRGARGRRGRVGRRGPAGAIGAPGGRGAPGAEAAADPIVGSWTVTVTRPGLPTLTSLQTYTKGRGVVESASGGTARSTSHGAWRRIARHRYAVTMVFFRYDPASGAYLGTVKLRRVLQFARDNQSFTGVSVAELRNPAGDLLPGSNARRDTEAGVRIAVEPIPAQP